MRGWVWRLYLGVGALATGLYYLLPQGPRAVLNVLVGASATAAIAVGTAWHRPARRLAWWLIAAASGPDAYAVFVSAAANPLGQIVLFGFLWSLSFHLLNGIRHLAWDAGYGFDGKEYNMSGWAVVIGTVVITLLIWIIGLAVW